MEEDHIKATTEELRQFIRQRVLKKELMPLEMLEKTQSLLARREKQVSLLLNLCNSVAAYETVVAKLQSVMGLKDDGFSGAAVDATPSPCESIPSETRGCHSPATVGSTSLSPKLPNSQHLNRDNGKNIPALKQSAVVLTRLSTSEIRALCRPKSSKRHNENDSPWTPDPNEESKSEDETENNSSDSDFIPPNKRKKMDRTSPRKPKDSKNIDAARGAVKTTSVGNKINASRSANEDTVSKPQHQFSLKTRIVAKRKTMDWQQGEISQIITEKGQTKYKIHFEEKGKKRVSAHHIAFDHSPKVQQLCVGARVVVKTQANPRHFRPGILAEMPDRKNKMRFLVFFDDHKPSYVSLPVIHRVCRPLKNPCDDIEDDTHRTFMTKYLKSWPCAPMAHYLKGRLISAEYNGDQQECEVLEVDCSLMKVVFKVDEHMEWIYRGSPRLKQLLEMWKNVNPC